MSLQNLVIGAVLLAALGAAGFLALKQLPVGASAGPDHYVNEFFYAGLSSGASCFSTTTTGTLSASILEKHGCIEIDAAGAGQAVLSLTLAASSTLSNVLPAEGMCRTWWVDTDAVAAGTTTTIVAGAGSVVVGHDATGAGTGADVIDGNEYGRFTLCKKDDSDIAVYVEEFIHAD